MSYQAVVYKVMIASPSDVPRERELIRGVIQSWNDVHSEEKGIVLMPVGWETHSSPEMGARPQKIINDQVLKDCDLLIAVFWTRLGSPTGISTSGTVEEIDAHIAKRKPAMIYFSLEPVRLDGVDQNQYQALLAFKESCKAKGLIDQYETAADFRNKLTLQLAHTVIRKFAGTNAGTVAEIDSRARKDASGFARFLLIEAAQDPVGAIQQRQTMTGLHVQTNGREFVEQQTPREQAKWRAAIQELEAESWIEDRTGEGEVFFVTGVGYGIAEMFLRARDASTTSQPETETQRKVRKILEMKGRPITVRELRAENLIPISGRVRGELEVSVRDCDEDNVFVEVIASGTHKSYSVSRVLIAYDDARQRPALEVMP